MASSLIVSSAAPARASRAAARLSAPRLSAPLRATPLSPTRAGRSLRMSARAAISVGADAPDFTLMGAGFATTSLSEFKGQKVVLAFFPAAFSGDADGGCQCQLAALNAVADMDGVNVLGISKDTPFTMGGWEQAQGWNFKCLSDMDLAVSKQYVGTFDLGKFLDDLSISTGFTGYETSCRGCVVIDEEGKVTYSWVGMEDGKIHPGVLPDIDEIMKAVRPFMK